MATIYFIWIIRIRFPFELETISKPIQIQKIPNNRPDWTPKSESYTPLKHCTVPSRHLPS